MSRISPAVLDALGTVARVWLAVVWIVAGVSKVGDLNQNYAAVKAYQLFPDAVSSVIGSGQPFVEIALGLLVLVGFGTRMVAVISVFLLVVYIIGIAQSWARGLSIDCGCFTSGGEVGAGQTQYPQDIARDVGLLVLAVWLVVRPRTLLSLDTKVLGGPAGE